MEYDKNKRILTGNEAIARGFYETGGVIAASYPGSPTVEILEKLDEYKEIYSEFSTNEKVALEVAIGGSFYGVRSMASMKHVGVNIASDPLMTFTQTPIKGGFLLVTGDDPGLASSQNEQDNRIFGKFANMGILDPSDSQEAKEFTKKALELSEKFSIPMMLRITSRLCHSRSVVTINDRVMPDSTKGMEKDHEKYCMIPPQSRDRQFFMKERLKSLENFAYETDLNSIEIIDNTDTLIVTSGLMYYNLKELDVNASIWKLGLIYPISEKRAKEITKRFKRVIVLEEMTPFIENELKIMGISCEGKKYFCFTGELHQHLIEEGLHRAGIIKNTKTADYKLKDTVKRPPVFCTGCPHRPTFDILKKSKAKIIIGDIGCYSLAALPPFDQSNSIISMGASIGIVKGLQKSMISNEDYQPLVAVIGDGTFFHSGLPGFINLHHQRTDKQNITIIVLDNRTTAMTGGQPNASSGLYNDRDDMKVGIKTLIEAIGFDRVKEINQYDYKAAAQLFKEEIAYDGLSIIIVNGPCTLKYNVEEPYYYVEPHTCISCRACIRTACPPLRMVSYEGFDKLTSSIDKDMCVGCSVCAQVCLLMPLNPQLTLIGGMRKLVTNIMLGGVGGQGLVLMTRIISQVALKCGFDVKSNDVVGLSQRGGMIWGNVRYGERVFSPNIPPKQVDVLLAMEPLEALRWSSELKDNGLIIMNSKRWYPIPVQQEKSEYPEDEIAELKNNLNVIDINAFEESVKLGKKQVSNVMLLGILAKNLDLDFDIWLETIKDNVPNKTVNINIEAFELGYNYSC